MPDRRRDTPFKLGFHSILEVTGQEYEYLCSLEDGGVERLSARKTVLRQGGTRDVAYIVKMGWLVEQKILRDGRRQIQNFRLPGEVVGLDGLTYTKALYSVAALTDAELILCPSIGSRPYIAKLRALRRSSSPKPCEPKCSCASGRSASVAGMRWSG